MRTARPTRPPRETDFRIDAMATKNVPYRRSCSHRVHSARLTQ